MHPSQTSRTLRTALFTAFVAAIHAHTYCTPPQPVTPPRCAHPPVIRDFDLAQYTGKWYQLFTSGTSTHTLSTRCATANYTQLPDGTLSMLNCHVPEGETAPQCQRALASRRVNGKKPHLEVRFSPHGERVPYNVAAVLGDAESGYEAAAVYECRDGREGIVVLARERERAGVALDELMRVMKCGGYDVGGVRFYVSVQEGCRYFEGGVGGVVDEWGGEEAE